MANSSSEDETDTLRERPTRIQPYQFEPVRQDFERVPEHRVSFDMRFSMGFAKSRNRTSVWGVSAVAMLDSSVNCVCVWSTKKLPMPAYCVAANCNNSQTTPGITMHELPRNRPAVRRKWIKFIQFKRADFLAAPHHAHLRSEHFSECDFANPMDYRMSKLTRCFGTLSKSCLTGSN